MEKAATRKLLITFLAASALLPSLALAADLPPTLTGTLLNPAGDTLTFGSPATTASLAMTNGSTLINDGTWNAYAGTIAPPSLLISPFALDSIVNTGILNIDAGTGTFAILDYTPQPSNFSVTSALTFTNTGTLNLNSGSFYLAASDTGSTSGTFNLASNTTLGLAGNLTFDDNSSVTGAGDVLLSTDVRKYPSTSFTPTTANTPPAITFNGTYNITGTTTIFGASVIFNHDVTLNNLQLAEPDPNTTNVTRYPSTLAGTGAITLTGSGTTTSTYTWTGGPSMLGSGTTFSSTGIPRGTTLHAPALLVTGTLDTSGLLVDGTAITIAPGARLAFGGGYFTNGATITNNGLLTSSGTFAYVHTLTPTPDITLTNNNMIYVAKGLAMGQNTRFNNNGTVLIGSGTFQVSGGTESPDSVITNKGGTFNLWSRRNFLNGTINNLAFMVVITNSTTRLGPDLHFTNKGGLYVESDATLLLEAPQQADSTGTFAVESTATLEFAADYDFSSATGPSLIHWRDSDGLVIIDPGVTLTLPLDTAFAGTIQVDGTLIIAAPLNPANVNMTPNFTIATPTPEPTTLTLLGCTLPLLLKRRRPTPA